MRVQLKTMLTIPKVFLDKLGWAAGDWVEINIGEGHLVITRTEPPERDDEDTVARLMSMEEKVERVLSELARIRRSIGFDKEG